MQKPALYAVALALVACVPDIDEMASEARRRKDAAVETADATASPTSTSQAGTVSCYTEGSPTNTCTLPVHCCFTNYSAQHNGYCSTSACSWGTIDCDGPEDCATGERCCSHAITSADGTVGYRLACQATACGPQPQNEELCHPDGPPCGSGTCVTAYGNNYDLPRTLYICR